MSLNHDLKENGDSVYQPENFQTFRNKLHHRLVKENELDIIVELLENKSIDYFYERKDYLKALYLLSLVDYVLKKNDLPVCAEYSEMRRLKLKDPYYVGDSVFEKKVDDCIEEFARHNIYEGDLYDAI